MTTIGEVLGTAMEKAAREAALACEAFKNLADTYDEAENAEEAPLVSE